MDSKIAAALLGVTTAALDTALLSKADASALAALLSTVDGLDTPLDVDTKIANALLGLATEAFVAAQLASRDASITALQASKADATLLASYATNAALSASETALQSALDAILAELAALQLSGGGVVNAPAWAGFTTWELLRGSNVVRNLHFVAPLSAALANGDDTLSITADCYSVAAADAALAAALLAYYTSSQVDSVGRLPNRNGASASFTAGGFQLEGYAMTLSAFVEHRPHLHADAGETLLLRLPVPAGHGLQLGDVYVSAADNDYVGVTGTFLGSQGVWSTARLDFSVPPGGIAKLHFGAFGGSIPGLVQQSAGTLDLYSMQIRASAFEGESVSVTDLLADSLALTGSATLDGLTAQGNIGCDQLLCNDVNCTDVFTTGVDHFLRCAHSHRHRRWGRAVVHGGCVRQLAEHQRRGQRGPAELRHGNHRQHTHHQQHGQRRELHHSGRRVHGHADGLGRSNRGKLRSHRRAHRRHADDRCGLHRPAGLREPGLHLRPRAAECRQAAWSAAT